MTIAINLLHDLAVIGFHAAEDQILLDEPDPEGRVARAQDLKRARAPISTLLLILVGMLSSPHKWKIARARGANPLISSRHPERCCSVVQRCRTPAGTKFIPTPTPKWLTAARFCPVPGGDLAPDGPR